MVDKQKAKGQGNILKLALGKFKENLGVFLMRDKMQWLALGMTPSPKHARGCCSALFLTQHSGSLTPYSPSASSFSAFSPPGIELMLTLYREANLSHLFLHYP